MSYRHQTEEMAVKSSQNEMIRMSFYSTRHWSCYSRSPILKFHFRNIPTSLLRHQPFQSCQGQHGWRSESKAIRPRRVGLRVPMDSKYFWENAQSPDLATHTRVSFLLTPTAVPEKAANQPVWGGDAILWLKCWLCLYITAQRAILGTTSNAICFKICFPSWEAL